MKSRIVMTVGVAVCLAAGMAQPLRAQNTSRVARSGGRSAATFALAPDPAEQLDGRPYSPQTLEDMRAELLDLVDTVQEFGVLVPRDVVDSESLQRARVEIQQMSEKQLSAFRAVIDPARLHARLQRARAVLEEHLRGKRGITMNTDVINMIRQGLLAADPSTFPAASESCTSSVGTTSADATTITRTPTAVIAAADLVWQTADALREVLKDVCDEVIAGENATGVCGPPIDTVWVVAKFVDFTIHFCEDDLTGAVGDASYLRLGALNDALAADTSNLSTQITGVDTHLSNVDTHISVEIAALDAHVTALFAALSSQVANVQSSVDQANQRLLKSIAIQTQIMKLELEPDGQRVIAPLVLACTGSNCPTNLLSNCTGPNGTCTFNNVGPLP